MPAYAWIVASLTSNVAIIACEYINRNSATFGGAITRTWYLIALAQVCLFITFNRHVGASHWFLAWAVFALGNAMMRVGAVAWTSPQEVSSWYTVITGITVMLGGALLMKSGLRP